MKMNTSFEEMLNKNIAQESTFSVHFEIDGKSVEGTPTERSQFVEFFHELQTLILSDNKEYWVLYDAINPETPFFKECYWCIPTSEVDFRRDPEGGWNLVGGITLAEDEDDECEFITDAYTDALNNYNVFMSNLGHYILYNPKADEVTFKFYKAIQKWASAEYSDEHMVCFMEWIEHHWGAYMVSILNKEFKYMNLTQLVWESWEEV